MNKHSIFRSVAIVSTALLMLVSCDKDYNEIGSDIVGDDHFDFLVYDQATVRAYNQVSGAVQSNNLPVNALGIYNNPVFGKTKANFVTELSMDSENRELDPALLVSLDSVVLTVPYFSRKTSTSGGAGTYELDSIYGTQPISLSIFESGYVINDLDPNDNFQTVQKYYSDEDSKFNTYKRGVGAGGTSIPNGTRLNNGTDPSQNTSFAPSNKELIVLKKDKGLQIVEPHAVAERQTPRMKLFLDKAYFQKKILEAPAGKLDNNSIFQEYFKGLYFQVEDKPDGTLMQLDFSQGKITLYYTEFTALEDADDNPATPKTPVKWPETDPLYPGDDKLSAREFVLNMTGNTVNLSDFTPSGAYLTGVSNPNRNEGDAKLFLKGGAGSVAIIDVFGPDNFGVDGVSGSPDGVSDELNIIRNQGWLINEANLTFYIDNATMGTAPEPQRISLYDLTNKRGLVDLYDDRTTLRNAPKFDKYIHDGLIQREDVSGGRGVKYRVRITNHIRNLIRKDSTNVRMGLAVTESITIYNNSALKIPVVIPGAFATSPAFNFDRIPASSVMNPLGTILYGNNILEGEANYDKRLKLEIYYTKPN